jgi:hypothetical protein
VSEDGAGELGEEAFDKIEPGTVLRGENHGICALGLGASQIFA